MSHDSPLTPKFLFEVFAEVTFDKKLCLSVYTFSPNTHEQRIADHGFIKRYIIGTPHLFLAN